MLKPATMASQTPVQFRRTRNITKSVVSHAQPNTGHQDLGLAGPTATILGETQGDGNNEMKAVAFTVLVIGGLLAAWFVWGERRDAWRQEQTRKRLAHECLSNLHHIQELLNGYKREHGAFPSDLALLRDSDPQGAFTFRCRLCYNFTRTIFSLPVFNSNTNPFAGWEGFAKCSYAYVTTTNSTSDTNQLLVFCVGLHPDAHVLFRDGQVKAMPPAEFVSRFEALPKPSIIYPSNFWTAPERQ